MSSTDVFALDQIVTQLQTQWGGNDEGKTRTWVGTDVTYSMPDVTPTNRAEVPSEGGSDLVTMTPLMKSIAREAFELWDDAIAINLTESVGDPSANITFNYSSDTDNDGTYASQWWSGTVGTQQQLSQAQVWFSTSWSSHDGDSDMYFGGYGRTTYVHEIGHTLGLSHPGTYDSSDGTKITYVGDAEYAQDTRQYTIMSYFGGWSDPDKDGTWQFIKDGDNNDNAFYAQTPMVHDLLAIQDLYGADLTTRTGDTSYGFYSTADRAVYDFFVNNLPILTIWDAGGTDWLNVSGWSVNQTIDLREGHYSSVNGFIGNIGIAYGAQIENALGGSGSDTMYGNGLDNVLDGYFGADTMQGFRGDDTYYVDNAGDQVIESDPILTGNIRLSSGVDTVVSSINYTLGDYVENLTLQGASSRGQGNALNNTLTGGLNDDELFGYGGDDTLNGGYGADYMAGGSGDDTYFVDDFGDNVHEVMIQHGHYVGSGIDTVNASINYTLGSYLENLNLLESGGVIRGTGNGGDNTIAGNSYDNRLYGLEGDDTLRGGAGDDMLDGGTGVDIMAGGSGDDTYLVDNVGDQVVEIVRYYPYHISSGIDTVYASVDFTLAGYVENLTLVEGSAAVLAVGNALDNTIAGNSADNALNGEVGADVLYGGKGADQLGDGGADSLEIRDVLYGGAGNDTYDVWSTIASAQDIVYEGADVPGQEGGPTDVDTINSHGEFFRDFYSTAEVLRIAEDANVEFPQATYLIAGQDSNALIFGNDGTNIISTYGGSKTVDAGGGTDAVSFSLFDLDAAYDGANTLVMHAGSGLDYVYDFASGVDKVDLSAFAFGVTGQQVLDQGVDVFGSDANSSADDYVYFYLTDAGGVDNYVAFVGLTSAQLQAADFITA